ncbi:Hypothetical protein D9617_10g074030 [Elsinoe fawcettii]|nr:Hypothetical protein D9617_10g074030 [Elsinoe fawcettii]
MVNTRRLTGDASDAANPPSPVTTDHSNAQGSNKVTRALRNLQIDGNIALGGSGSLKRKRGQKESAAVLLTPPRSHSVSSQYVSPTVRPLEGVSSSIRDPITVVSGGQLRRAQGAAPNHASSPSARYRSPDAKHSSDKESSTSANDTTADARLSSLYPAAYWFLPGEGLMSGSDEGSDGRTEGRAQSQSDTIGASFGATGDEMTGVSHIISEGRSIRGAPQGRTSEDVEAIPEHEITLAMRSQAKLKRELRKLEIRANPALSLKDPDIGTSPPHKGVGFRVFAKSSRKTGDASERSPAHHLDAQGVDGQQSGRAAGDLPFAVAEPLEPFTEKAKKKLSREMRKLEIRAKERLGGRTASPSLRNDASDAPPEQTARFPRRQVRHKRSPRSRRTRTMALARSRSPTRRKSVVALKPFPTNPPDDLIDHILFLLADAAGERDLVAALHDKAQNSIRRDVRWLPPAILDARDQHEMDILEKWTPLDEGTIKIVNDLQCFQDAIEKHEARRQILTDQAIKVAEYQRRGTRSSGLIFDAPESDVDTDDGALDSNMASNIIVNSDPADTGAEDTQDLLDDEDDEADEGGLDEDMSCDADGYHTGNSKIGQRVVQANKPVGPELGTYGGTSSNKRCWKGKGRAVPE